MQHEETKKKSIETCLEKYGTKYALQNDEVRNKSKETCIKKYGAEYSTTNDEIKEKTKKRNFNKYGVKYVSQIPEVQEKIKMTNNERYGEDYGLSNQEIRNKIKNTNLIKYGVENPSQCPDFLDKQQKNAFKIKTYISKTNKQYEYQGYENFALDELINNQNIDENEIINLKREVPELWYNDLNGIKRRHFVDIYLKNLNKCIEIKSTYTINLNYDNVLQKQKYAKKDGYNYEIWIFDKKGKLEKKII